MLNSMTGFGAATADKHGISCSVEIRSVNNRYFKASIKLPDKLAMLEPDIDRTLREKIARGSIVMSMSVKDHLSTASVSVNQEVLKLYVEQVRTLEGSFLRAGETVNLVSLLTLPGVVEAGEDTSEYLEGHRELAVSLVREAISKLGEMRAKEGAALWDGFEKALAGDTHRIGEDQRAGAGGGAGLP